MTITVSPYFRNGVQLDTVVVEGITGRGSPRRGARGAGEGPAVRRRRRRAPRHARSRVADDVSKTVNYATVATLAAGHLAGESVALIETLAERIAFGVLEIETCTRWTSSFTSPTRPSGCRSRTPTS